MKATIEFDTSVALRLLTGTPADQAESARALVANAAEPVSISDRVVSDVYVARRHHYAVAHVDAVRALMALLGDRQMHGTGVALAVLNADAAAPTSRKVGMMDRLIHADYARDDVELLTFDRALARLPGTRRP
jgi:predicted nucleic acid-binding protein